MYEAPAVFVFAGLGSAVTSSDVCPTGAAPDPILPEVELD